MSGHCWRWTGGFTGDGGPGQHGAAVHLTGDHPGQYDSMRVLAGIAPSAGAFHAQLTDRRREPVEDRFTLCGLRRTRPRRRTRLQRQDNLVLRDQRARRQSLRAPLARRSKPGRHHGNQLVAGRTRGHPDRRLPLPRRLHRRQTRWPRARNPLRSLGAHGRSHRRTPARMARHRERPRTAVLTRDTATRRRRRP